MSEQGFEWEGIWITDPTMSECGRFEVNPIEYYGEQYERYAYVAGILHDNKSQKTQKEKSYKTYGSRTR